MFIIFLANVIWQYPALGYLLSLEYRVVLFDKLVKKGSLRAMALEINHALPQTGILASQHLQHNRVLAIRCLVERIKPHPAVLL